MDVPWDGVQNGGLSCFFCSGACVIVRCEHICAQMGWLDVRMVTSNKRKIHMGNRGTILSLVRRVRVANGCSRSQEATWSGYSKKSGLLHSLAFRPWQRWWIGILLCAKLFTTFMMPVCFAKFPADFLIRIALSIRTVHRKAPRKYLCTTDVWCEHIVCGISNPTTGHHLTCANVVPQMVFLNGASALM